jgi:hypothetical protein
MVDAVVLAGAANDGKLATCDNAKYEALISVHAGSSHATLHRLLNS